MNVSEYEATGRNIYRAFAEAVATILEAAIAVHGSIKFQQIQYRAKDQDSLRTKLKTVGVSLDSAIEDVVKDLAGCRLVLYSNSDVARLNNARLLFDNFEIVWSRTKFHFPRNDDGNNSSQFIGDNYVVRLKPDRAALIEYRTFAGLLCEIQVQTILNHAWSETAHDTIYKRPSLNGIGADQIARIDARMKSIQEQYLLPAGYEFQQVLNDFERLATGQRLIDADILAAIRDAQNNNDRVNLLEQYENHVFDLLDDPASVAPDVRAALIKCAQQAVRSPVEPIESPIGNLPGQTAVDVIEKVLSILDRLRYVEPEQAFETLVQLYCDAPEQAIRDKIQAAVSELAKYELYIWRRAGPAVQEILLNAIAKTPPQRLSVIRPLMIEVGAQTLLPEVTGTSSTSQTFTWEIGTVVVTDQLVAVRNRAMKMLMELFQSSVNVKERHVIFLAMDNATRLPHQGQYGDALLIRALQDSTSMVTFLTEHVETLPNDLAQSIEQDLFFLYRRNREMPTEVLNNSHVRTERDGLTAAILSFRDRLNGNPDYVVFKTLVGFKTVFLYEWDLAEKATDFEAKDQYRKERISEFVPQIHEVNSSEWFERLNRYATVDSDDLATFPYMGEFIADIAAAKPLIAYEWLMRLPGEPLERFKPEILRGLHVSDRAKTLAYVDLAIAQGEDLSGIMHFLCNVEPLDPTLFERAFHRCVELWNERAIWAGMEAALKRPDNLGMALARQVLLTAIEKLDEAGRYRWTEPVWVWGTRGGLLASLTDEDTSILFDYIEKLPKIDYRSEEILALFALRFPERVVGLFGRRLVRERAMPKEFKAPQNYRAIPYDFSRLHEAMSEAAEVAVDSAFEWSREEGSLVEFSSARFVAILFPNGSSQLAKKLSVYVDCGDAAQQAFVVAVLKSYKGNSFIHSILRNLVAVLPADDPLLRHVRIAFAATGVMHGEFGFRDALVDQRNALRDWLSDERQPVREFANELLRSIENDIAVAEKRAREDIAMRRLEYGEPLESPPTTSDKDDEI